MDPNLNNEIRSISGQIMNLSQSLGFISLKLSDLNTELKSASKASDKQSSIMGWLTGGLVIFAIAQAVVAYLPYHLEKTERSLRKGCYERVLQTSDINLNYQNCLRSEGLDR